MPEASTDFGGQNSGLRLKEKRRHQDSKDKILGDGPPSQAQRHFCGQMWGCVCDSGHPSQIKFFSWAKQGKKILKPIHCVYLLFLETSKIPLFYYKWGTCGVHIHSRETDGGELLAVCVLRSNECLRYTKHWMFRDDVYITYSWKLLASHLLQSFSKYGLQTICLRTFWSLNGGPHGRPPDLDSPRLSQDWFWDKDVLLVGRNPLRQQMILCNSGDLGT